MSKLNIDTIDGEEILGVYGARVHNLKNIDVKIPRNKLVVVTGLSGSGKSSLAFDTIYAEGQRRYMETFSAYARQFMGNLERPDVDKITGLSPVIAIEQKSTNKNPRSTVGTITEVYDFMRLLYARIGEAHSYITGERMIRYTEQQIIDFIHERYNNKTIVVLAPQIKGRKGHYRELFEWIRKQGFLRVRVDGEIKEITFGMHLDRYKIHDIELVVDKIKISPDDQRRLTESVQTALRHGKGALMVFEPEENETRYLSKLLMDPESGISYGEPEPNSFSFNSPYGACPRCNGLGQITEIDYNKIIPNSEKTIRKGGLAPIGEYRPVWIFKQVEAIAEKYGFTLDTPIVDIPEKAINVILYGSDEVFKVKNEYLGISSNYALNFDGIVSFIQNQSTENTSKNLLKWASSFMNKVDCPDCKGQRLKTESLHYLIAGKSIADLANMDLIKLSEWFVSVEKDLNERQLTIGIEIIREIKTRIQFLLDVGLDYLSLNRPARSLSGGESQRIRLATQIGSQLVGVLYILDEPSIGLHQRDNHRLIKALQDLRDIGNSVIVVEHDKDMILAADYVIDIGPGAGRLGGKVVGAGTPESLKECKSITSQYLNGKKRIEIPKKTASFKWKGINIDGSHRKQSQKCNPSCSIGFVAMYYRCIGKWKVVVNK